MSVNETLHPPANLVAHSAKDGKTELVVDDSGGCRVFKILMNTRGAAGEDRAALFGVVADCDHVIELLSDKLIDRFRAVA